MTGVNGRIITSKTNETKNETSETKALKLSVGVSDKIVPGVGCIAHFV
jgi:hypothetical protein